MSGRFYSAKFASFLMSLILFTVLFTINGQSNAQTSGGDGRIEPTPPGFSPRPGIADFEIAETTLTDQWAVTITSGTNVHALATQLGFENLGRVANLGNTYLFRKLETDTSATMARAATNNLRGAPQVVDFEQQVLRQHYPRPVPTDTLVGYQWHLQNTVQWGGIPGEDANVVPAWNNGFGFDGTGATIAIVDDGLQHTHPDLAPNYYAAGSYDYNDWDSDPMPSSSNGHGTAAGGIAAAADDGSCGVGAAFDAQLSGIRLIAAATTDVTDAFALSHDSLNNNIYSNSWGPSDNGRVYAGPGSSTREAFEDNVNNGRGGLGNIYVFAAGNGKGYFDNSNADGYANSRYTIAVAATMPDGKQASYSEPGSNILVNAPSGNVTTDLMGTNGYNNSQGWSNNCTDSFGGTSSSAPLVSGVIAQMLEANSNLGWRDVQHILVNSSEKNDPSDSSWRVNGAGHDYSDKYGFGRIDADAATTMAQTWTNIGPELYHYGGENTLNASIPDGTTFWTTNPAVEPSYTDVREDGIIVTENIRIEHVTVNISAYHYWRGDIIIELESPSGTVSQILTSRRNDGYLGDTGDLTIYWDFTSTDFWDELSAGEWTIRVADGWYYDGLDTGTLYSWSLRFYGSDICGLVTEIPGSECEALLDLYSDTQGANWTTKTDWTMTTTPCSWHGVSCSGGHVTELNLSSNNVYGSLSTANLVNLPFLQTLDLHENQVGDSSPNDFSSLINLTYLDLSHNQLDNRLSTYAFPSSLQHLFLNDNDDLGGYTSEGEFEIDTPNLITIDLGNTGVYGGAAADFPASLQHLYLYNTGVNGNIQNYSSLTNLLTLDLSNNQITGTIPTWTSGLVHVDLSANLLSGSIPDLTGMTNLETLHLHNNQLGGNIPPSVSTLGALTTFDVGYNKLSAATQALRDFLNTNYPQWNNTQTVPVKNIMMRDVMPTSVTVIWTAIPYTGDGGYYELDYTTDINWSSWDTVQTANKTITSHALSGLAEDTTYYFRMRTYTPVHGIQQNALWSDYSNIYSHDVVWATISEQELFDQMETEINNNQTLEIEFALPEFFADTISITIRTKDGTVGLVTVALVDNGAGYTNIHITSITVGGAAAPAEFASSVNSELPSLLTDSFDALLTQKIEPGHDLDSMFVIENGIYAGFLQP